MRKMTLRPRRVCIAWALGALLLLVSAPGKAVDLAVQGIEVTQAIQNFDVTDPTDPSNNSNVLVAGNHTAARVYVAVTNSTTPVAGVTGFLSVYVNGSLHAIVGANAPGFITAPLSPNPDNEGDALNFTLPIDLEEGDDVDLVVDLDPMNTIAEDDETNNSGQLDNLDFECRETPEIVYSTVNYTAATETDPTTLGTPDPLLIAPGAGDQFVFGIFPFPDDRAQYHAGPFGPINWTQNIDSSFSDFLTFLEDCRQAINPVPKFLYAWFRENPFFGNGAAIGAPGNVAFGNTQTSPDRYQRTFAHELGHLFGLGHNGRDLAPETGWDVENLVGLGHVMPGSKLDIMVAGQLTPSAWVDDITYEFFLNSDCLECGMDSGGLVAVPYATAVLQLDPGGGGGGGGELNPVFQFPRVLSPTRSGPEGEVIFRALSETGQVLQEVGVTPTFETETGEALTTAAVSASFWELIDIAGPYAVELVYEKKIVDRIVRSPNPPEISILSPRRGETLNGPFEVSWQGRDADGDELTYIVQYSSGYDKEGVERWVPLDVALEKPSTSSDTRWLAASESAKIRVLASDGLNTSSAEVEGLYVPGSNPPRATIADKGTGSEYLEGSLVILQANAYDREDGKLTGKSLRWASDLDGALGSGATLQTTALSPGRHRITLTAVDEAGGESTDQIDITIQASPWGQALKARVTGEGRQPTPLS